jgi:hypothetical protein
MTANASLTDELMGQLQGAPMQGLAQQLGIDSVQAEQAVGVALPMLFGALGQNTAQPQGAADLFGALQRDHSSANGAMDMGGLLGGLGGLLGAAGGGAGAAGGLGGLGSILGSVLEAAPVPATRSWMQAPSWAISLAVSSSRPSPGWVRPRAWVAMQVSCWPCWLRW